MSLPDMQYNPVCICVYSCVLETGHLVCPGRLQHSLSQSTSVFLFLFFFSCNKTSAIPNAASIPGRSQMCRVQYGNIELHTYCMQFQ